MLEYDIIFCIVTAVIAVGLYILTGYAVKYLNSKWRVLYALPLLVAVIMIPVFGYRSEMLPAYIGMLFPVLGFFKDSVKFRRVTCVFSVVLAAAAVPVCMLSSGYNKIDYVADFKTGFTEMKKYYVLAKHKEIVWDDLYNEYLPRFREIDNDIDNAILWSEFTAEFHDGHTYFVPNSDINDRLFERGYGNDYGLSLIPYTDGGYAAVCVKEGSEAERAGITNGTVITLWDGIDPADAAKKSEMYFFHCQTDKDNADFYCPILAAGVGGDTVTVTFLDDDGVEQTAVLKKIGTYYKRYEETINTLNRGVEAGNMSWTEIDDKTVCLRIKSMMYDSRSSQSGDHMKMKLEIRSKVQEFSSLGFENLVIDLRDNGGGSGDMVKAIAETLAPVGQYYYVTDGLWDVKNNCYATDENGSYICGTENYFTGEGSWNGKIVILVNANSVSASDHLVMVMRGMENVTVMGFSESNGSAQGASGVYLESGALGYSGSLLMNKDGSIFIDSGTDYESGNDIDVRVPFDRRAVKYLFDYDEDYVMTYVLEYLAG